MVVAALVAACLALIGTLGTAYFNYRSRRVDQTLTEQEQQFEFWKEKVKVLQEDKKDLQTRLTQMDERLNIMQAAHSKCEERLEALTVQNALLERLLHDRT